MLVTDAHEPEDVLTRRWQQSHAGENKLPLPRLGTKSEVQLIDAQSSLDLFQHFSRFIDLPKCESKALQTDPLNSLRWRKRSRGKSVKQKRQKVVSVLTPSQTPGTQSDSLSGLW